MSNNHHQQQQSSAFVSHSGDFNNQTTDPSGKIKLSAVHAAAKLFKEPLNVNSKTPISLLQEICSKSLIAPPNYELISSEGATHKPMFAYRCSLAPDLVAVAKGNSKKKAKHASAMAVLTQIKEKNTGVNDMLAESLGALMLVFNEISKQTNILFI